MLHLRPVRQAGKALRRAALLVFRPLLRLARTSTSSGLSGLFGEHLVGCPRHRLASIVYSAPRLMPPNAAFWMRFRPSIQRWLALVAKCAALRALALIVMALTWFQVQLDSDDQGAMVALNRNSTTSSEKAAGGDRRRRHSSGTGLRPEHRHLPRHRAMVFITDRRLLNHLLHQPPSSFRWRTVRSERLACIRLPSGRRMRHTPRAVPRQDDRAGTDTTGALRRSSWNRHCGDHASSSPAKPRSPSNPAESQNFLKPHPL